MVSVGTNTSKSANVADHVSGTSTCMEVVIRSSWEERYTWDNLLSANSSSSSPRIIPLVRNFGGECILAVNLLWRIGGFEINSPIFHPPKSISIV